MVSPQNMQYVSFGPGYAPHLRHLRTAVTNCMPQCMQNWSLTSTCLRQCGQTRVPFSTIGPGNGGRTKVADGSGGAYFTVGGIYHVGATGVVGVIAEGDLRTNGLMLSANGGVLSEMQPMTFVAPERAAAVLPPITFDLP